MAVTVTAGSGFMREAQKFPMLEAGEERALALRWREDGDLDACDRMVQAHLRLVIRIASRFRGYRRPIEDFISVGCIGLMEAVKRYDPDRGARLSTYATWWIRAAMQAEAMRGWSLVKIGTTATEKKLFFGLRTAKANAGAAGDRALDVETAREIGEFMGVAPAAVLDMDNRLARADQSLNVALDHETGTEWIDTLVDPGDTPEAHYAAGEVAEVRHNLLTGCLARLDARERRIIAARHLSEDPVTLRVLGAELGISCERVRQIEARAIGKLATAMRGDPGSAELEYAA